MESASFRHLDVDAPRVLVVDGSRVVRRMIENVLRKDLPGVEVIGCDNGIDALVAIADAPVHLVTTALSLPDMDGLELARRVREHAPQAYVPIIVVSGNAQEHLEQRQFTADVTDYFDKSLGFGALAAFIRGYVRPEREPDGSVLYVEDSRVVATATCRMLERHGLGVVHAISAEDALGRVEAMRRGEAEQVDLVLTDVYLKGALSGGDLLARLRGEFGLSKSELPVVVMTGDANPVNQSALLRAGANDLVQKPIEERLLITKLLFQLRLARLARQRVAESA
ncbi:response regulator [Coralloluteibacterium stylophorae]|uniref:Response regulator n=1 Tax=Coralloluteibacterium stylophorae TaxID=1776034 RepID=A0A8J8AXK5_9GAMM|nr:response regulator [Coralloluteibacterium stylophorae]MBS7457029.1 response regulator [Coralloluteibacterium stylophorae]